jgi:HB1, ASXL, restriction endonuclease HTH domain
MSDETKRLAEWEAALQREVERWQRERSRVDSELQRATKKLELVRQMRSLEADPLPEKAPAALPVNERRATPTAVREMTQRILSESGRPLHISEIHKQFLNKGYAIPGGGTPFNILAHLVNDKSFVRVARGTYALAGSVPPDQVLPRAERKTKRRKRKRKSAARLRVEEA